MRLVLILALLFAVAVVTVACRRGQSVSGPVPVDTRPAGLDHRVVPGETLWGLADAYGITTRLIINANDLRSAELRPGQMLRIPGVTTRPTAAPAAPVVDTPDWYIPRSAWAQVPINEKLIDPMGVKPYRITVHHSSEMSVSLLDSIASLREIERQHMAGLGKNTRFACIGYHFIVGDDGRVFEGRPIRFQGAHATGPNNIGNIGICLLGDFDRRRPSTRQLVGMQNLLDRLCRMYGLTPSRQTIFCHKDFVPTACPGQLLEPVVRSYADRGGRR